MDLNKAIQYAQLVNEAYAPKPVELANRAGQMVSAGLGDSKRVFEIITTIYANDLATKANPNRGNNQVSIGMVLEAQAGGEAVIAFRGTEGIKEWVIDADFETIPCPFLASAGETEDGFTDMYMSVATGPGAGAPRLVDALPALPWKQEVESLTICGHSLGGALATLATLDIAVNSIAPFHDPTLYTYASPKTGNGQFVTKYNQIVANTFRIANDLDLVPRLPLVPYEHVLGDFALKPFTWIPPKFLLQPTPVCEHILTSYLYLLSLSAGGQVLEPDMGCVGPASFSGLTQEFEMKWDNVEILKREFASSPRRVAEGRP